MTKNIVIIGAGFAGLRTTLGLTKKLKDSSDYKIILIDKNSYHTYTPSLYEVATAYRGGGLRGKFTEEDFTENLAGSTCFVIRDILASHPVNFVQDEVTGVNLETRAVYLRSGDAITFEYCILAPGSQVAFYSVEGADTCCKSLKSLSDALRIRQHLIHIFKSAADNSEAIKVLIIGAGFSGVEITAEMAKYSQHLARRHGIDESRIDIKLLDSADDILSGAPKPLREKIRNRLKKLRIDIITGARINKIEPHRVYCEDGRNFTANFILWSGGIKGPELFQSIQGLNLDKSGRVTVNKFLQVRNFSNVFVIGDSALFYGANNKQAVPATAWAAEQQADVVIKNIIAVIRGQSPSEYIPKFPGFVSAAGGKYAVAYLYGFTFSGFTAWVLKRFIDLKYILSLYPFFAGLKIWIRELDLFTRND